MKVHLPNLISHHTFVVAECLSAPAILGCDFLIQHGLVDFENGTLHNRAYLVRKGKLSLQLTNSCMLVLDEDYPQAMPFKDTSTSPAEFNNLSDYHLALGPVLKEHKSLFKL